MTLGMLFLVAIILFRVFLSYQSYNDFISKDYYYINGEVKNSYQKSNHKHTYTVLKITTTDGLTFYTTTDNIGDYTNSIIRAKIYPSKHISFIDYLGYFYTKSDIKKITRQHTETSPIKNYISNQHKDQVAKSLYNAIFFASPIPKNIRQQISMLGSSHLIALSGFHIGILWGMIYLTIGIPYKLLQKRYFPHRHLLFDVGIITLFLLGLYVWYVGSPPSLVRSYAMAFVGWTIVLWGIELLSFEFLSIITLLLLIFNPNYLASISFWLSVCGVFYIFLLLKWCLLASKKLISIICIPIGIFILMLPIVHIIFPITTPWQLLSPLLSLLFVIFYPLSMLLHLLGLGNSLDTALALLIQMPVNSKDVLTPTWLFVLYVMLSLLAAKSKIALFLLFFIAVSFTIYLYIF